MSTAPLCASCGRPAPVAQWYCGAPYHAACVHGGRALTGAMNAAEVRRIVREELASTRPLELTDASGRTISLSTGPTGARCEIMADLVHALPAGATAYAEVTLTREQAARLAGRLRQWSESAP